MIKHIAFDFDGTLADSVDFCLAVFDKVFEKYMGKNAPEREQVYLNFGMNEPGVIRFFMGEWNAEAENDFYRFHRELHTQFCPEPFPGMVELLQFLKEHDIAMSIITGRSETTCNISLELLHLQHFFSGAQYGSPEKNDKAGQLRKVMQKNKLNADEFIYIGDAFSDVAACRAAGVKCLSAAWASTARISELEKVNPGLVFTSVAEMKHFIRDRI